MRHVWRQSASLSVTPAQYLNTLADVALKADREGKTLSSVGAGGSTASFVVFQNFRPSEVLELIDALRSACDEANLTAALAKLAEQYPSVTSYISDFSLLRNGGAL